MGEIRIGISGWRYEPWRGVFYPPGLPHRLELEYASRALPTIELNGSFYSLQRPEFYADWYDATPAGFAFGVKGPRYVTHILRLRNILRPMANFFASGILNLRDKLGPFLWQFPPNFQWDAERFEAFLDMLPRNTEQALSLARRRDARMHGRCRLAIDACRPLRHAVEIRHDSFRNEAFIALLRRQGVALVVADTAGKWPYAEDVTADFMYLRLHGEEELYASGYTEEALDRWARRIRAWSVGEEPGEPARISDRKPRRRRSRDVYCYFDNDIKVRAPFDAQRLMQKLGLLAAATPWHGPEPASVPPLRPWPYTQRRPDSAPRLTPRKRPTARLPRGAS